MQFWEKILTVLAIMTILSTKEMQAQNHAGIQKVGILVAMEKKLRMLENCFNDSSVVAKLCGMGKVNAAVGCVEMIRTHHPDIIISMGCAGGYGDGLHIGDVVVSKELAFHDVYCGDKVTYGQMQGLPARFKADSVLVEKALQVAERVTAGLIVTGDWFVDSKEKMREIIGHFPMARAVDMESAAIAQTCYIYGIPFISFHIVSDMPLEDEHASQYFNFWETVSDETFRVAKNYIELIMNQKSNMRQ